MSPVTHFDGPCADLTARLRPGPDRMWSSAVPLVFKPANATTIAARRTTRGSFTHAFAKLKAFLRAARTRSFDQECDLIGAAVGLFRPPECANYMRHSGYCVATTL